MAVVRNVFSLKNLRLPVNSHVIITDSRGVINTKAKIMGYSKDMTAICMEVRSATKVDWYDIDSVVLVRIVKRAGDVLKRQNHEW